MCVFWSDRSLFPSFFHKVLPLPNGSLHGSVETDPRGAKPRVADCTGLTTLGTGVDLEGVKFCSPVGGPFGTAGSFFRPS